MGNKFPVIAVLLLMIFLVKLLFIAVPFPLVSDEFERVRVAEHLLSTGEYPEFDPLVLEGAPFIYPPFPDYLLAITHIFTGIDLFVLAELLVNAFFIIFIYFAYLVSRKFLSFRDSIIFILFLGLTPLILKRFSTFVSEPIALTFLMVLFYLVLNLGEKFSFRSSKTLFAFSVFLSLIALTHFRTFSFAFGVIFLYFIYLLIKRNPKSFFFLKSFVLSAVFVSPWIFLNLQKLLSLNSVVNPFVRFNVNILFSFLTPWLSFLVFSSIIVFIFLLSIKKAGVKLKKFHYFKSEYFFLFWLFLSLLLFLFIFSPLPLVNQPYRFLLFLLFPSLLLGSFFIGRIMDSKNNFISASGFIFILLFIFSINYFPSTVYSSQTFSAIDYLNENVGNGKILALDESVYLLKEGYGVVFAPFMERVENSTEILFAIAEFVDGKRGLEFLEKHDISCIFLKNKHSLHSSVLSSSNRIYNSDSFYIQCLSNNRSSQ